MSTQRTKLSGISRELLNTEFNAVRNELTGTLSKLNNRFTSTWRSRSSGQDSAVQNKLHSFEGNNVHILSREDRWFGGVAKESIYVKVDQPLLQTLLGGGGLQHYLLVLKTIPWFWSI